MNVRIASAIVASVCASFGASASAVTLFTWDNDSEGWSGVDTYSTTVGVTHGTHSVAKDPNAGFAWPIQIGNWQPQFAAMNAAQKTNTTILIDVTATAEALPPDTFYVIDFWLWVHTDGGAAVASGIGQLPVIMDGQTHTYAFNYAAANKGGAANIDWSQVRFTTNSTNNPEGGLVFDPGVIHIDNFRIVPEPASLALVGLGGLAVLARRRA